MNKEKHLLDALNRYASERGWTLDLGPFADLILPTEGGIECRIPMALLTAAPESDETIPR